MCIIEVPKEKAREKEHNKYFGNDCSYSHTEERAGGHGLTSTQVGMYTVVHMWVDEYTCAWVEGELSGTW